MYAQKVEEDVTRRTNGDNSALLLDPKLNILPYTTLLSASIVSSHAVELELRNTIKEENRTTEYDAIVCGTGYDRQAYRNILFPTSTTDSTDSTTVPLSSLFSSPQSSTSETRNPSHPSIPQLPLDVNLPVSAFKRRLSDDYNTPSFPTTRSASVTGSSASSVDDSDSFGTRASNPSTAPSTSPSIASTPSSSLERSRKPTAESPPDFVVGENYRLQIPTKTNEVDGKSANFKPTIWLQGSCEKSHGISDSLLRFVSLALSLSLCISGTNSSPVLPLAVFSPFAVEKWYLPSSRKVGSANELRLRCLYLLSFSSPSHREPLSFP